MRRAIAGVVGTGAKLTRYANGYPDAVGDSTEAIMTKLSTIEDLRAAIADVEAQKREIDEQHRFLTMTLRYFESRQEQLDPPSGRTEDAGSELSDSIAETGADDGGAQHNSDLEDGVSW